ncbi:MAG: DUF1206 domain-containing protein, partial [Woeseiaceae bacterium]
LLGYAVWRFFQSILNADDHHRDAKGYIVRAGMFVSSISHLALAVYCAGLVWVGIGMSGGSPRSGGQENTDEIASWILSQPYGKWLLGLVGLCIIGAGLAQLVNGYNEGYRKWLEMNPSTLDKVTHICRVGLMARGVVFLIIGGMIIWAAVEVNPDKATGLGGALDALRSQPYGKWLLAIIAIGLLAFSVYSFIEAGYRRIDSRPGRI